MSKAASGVSLNLLTYRTPTITCWSDACLTGMGGYESSGRAWRWEIPLDCRGRVTLNCIEYIAWIITIQLFIQNNIDPEPCILSLLDNSSAISWIFKSSFDYSSKSLNSHLARHLATMMLDNDACLYSQHIAGSNNVIADSLSRDFHMPSHTLSSLIRSHSLVPAGFILSPLQDGINP